MPQAPIRLIAIDVDGTLLDSSHRVQATVAKSLAGLHQRGIRIVLATARSPQLMEPVLTQLGFLPFLICFSGAWIGDPRSQSTQQQSFFERELSVSAAQQVIDVASAYDLEPNVFYPFAWRVRRLTPEVKAESDITQTAPSLTPELIEKAKGPSKILIISRLDEEADTLQRIANAISPFTTATFSKPNYLEVIAPGVNKARSLAIFAERLGLDMSRVAAIGDGLNDIEMIEASAFGIAMGNAATQVKSVADWVTSSQDEAGVSEAVRELSRRGLV